MLIIRDSFLGVTRFDDFQRRLGISRNILAERLDHLVDKGVLTRVPYQQHPVRHDYRLTDKGRDLWLVLTAMREWGDRWEAEDGPPLEIEHRGCGHLTTVVPTCSSCGEPVDVRSVRARPGPGSENSPAEALIPPPRSLPV
jgi:DNA-binding HxlR family transcriptional regulator